MTTKAQLLQVSAAAYETALAEQQTAQQEQQRIYDALKESDARCNAASAAVRLAAEELRLAATTKADDGSGISAGDVARLKSGGPWMTVESVTDSSAMCAWAIGEDIQRRPFNTATLEKSAV